MRLFDRQGRVRERSPDRARRCAARRPRRPRPRPLHRPERHQGHRPARLGASRRPRTSASSICPRSAASGASPAPRSRRASSAATCRYEDIGGRDLDDYTYAFVRARRRVDRPRRHPPSGVALESTRRRRRRAAYPRIGVARPQGQLRRRRTPTSSTAATSGQKRYDVRRLERVDGIWTVMDAGRWPTSCERTRTELVDRPSARYNVGLTEADFTRRELEQDAR